MTGSLRCASWCAAPCPPPPALPRSSLALACCLGCNVCCGRGRETSAASVNRLVFGGIVARPLIRARGRHLHWYGRRPPLCLLALEFRTWRPTHCSFEVDREGAWERQAEGWASLAGFVDVRQNSWACRLELPASLCCVSPVAYRVHALQAWHLQSCRVESGVHRMAGKASLLAGRDVVRPVAQALLPRYHGASGFCGAGWTLTKCILPILAGTGSHGRRLSQGWTRSRWYQKSRTL